VEEHIERTIQAMNKIMLIGNLGRDPEMSYTTSGKAVTRFSLAVNRNTKTQSGERQEETEWFNIVFFDRLAEISNQYLKKGQKVFIEGRLTTRKYTDKTGVERTAVEVIANDMEMLTPKGQSGSGSGSGSYLNEANDSLGDLDDHPF
jgi:single-strand DNA-binding protein